MVSYVLSEQASAVNMKEVYEMGEEVGRGAFGVTCKCTEKATGQLFACKVISKANLTSEAEIDDVNREVEIMSKLSNVHPNIVSLKNTYEDDDAIYLVMDLCEGGELFDRIVAIGHYTETNALPIARTILQVIKVCHDYGVMHRDLKPENFLFENKEETSLLKVIDFGLSVFFKPGEKFKDVTGSLNYMAPEVLKGISYGPEVDVWSAGVILYALLSGFLPFWSENDEHVYQAIEFRANPWPEISDKAKDLVKQMLHPDPKKRLTPQQALDHPWLLDANNDDETAALPRLTQCLLINKLKTRALMVIAEPLAVENIQDGFKSLDIKNKGKVDIDDLRVGLKKLGHRFSENDLQEIMEVCDVDKDGYLNYQEFSAFAQVTRKIENEDHLRDAFDIYDKDGSGYIEIHQLRDAFAAGATSEYIINRIILLVDTDKDGRISYEEFAAMMKAGINWKDKKMGHNKKFMKLFHKIGK